MRKHSARKWLHFVLDLLPILVLPIFAIYEINHDHNTSIEVEQDTNLIVDFNQLQNNGDFASAWAVQNGSSGGVSNNVMTFTASSQNGQAVYPISLTNGHIFISTIEILTDAPSDKVAYFGGQSIVPTFNVSSSNWQKLSVRWSSTPYSYNILRDLRSSDWTPISCRNAMIFDLTQMFGSGNEPSIEQFNSWYQNDYYSYTMSRKELLVNYSTEILSNNDIGSQMLYAIYKPVKDYFNFNNVFNFGDIYHWFELNMFGGNAPMPIFIVWNIIVYQFLMDLMFLVYSIFMFIIDFTSECLERCFSFSRHGGSR